MKLIHILIPMEFEPRRILTLSVNCLIGQRTSSDSTKKMSRSSRVDKLTCNKLYQVEQMYIKQDSRNFRTKAFAILPAIR